MKLLVKYDQADACEQEIQHQMENWKYFDQYEEKPSYEQVQDKMHQSDYSFLEFYWEDIKEYLTELMQGKKSTGYWKASVNNFGWRNQNGQKFFKADTGEELLREVLPNCDCTFHVFNWRNGFCIRNWHHDSPMGNEYYYIVPIQYSTYEKEVY